MKKKHYILVITGQDAINRNRVFNQINNYKFQNLILKNILFTSRIDHIFDSVNFGNKNLIMHHGDLQRSFIIKKINQVNPDEIIIASLWKSHVKISFGQKTSVYRDEPML